MEKPSTKPKNPNFSSGPCAKRPGWSIDVLKILQLADLTGQKNVKINLMK